MVTRQTASFLEIFSNQKLPRVRQCAGVPTFRYSRRAGRSPAPRIAPRGPQQGGLLTPPPGLDWLPIYARSMIRHHAHHAGAARVCASCVDSRAAIKCSGSCAFGAYTARCSHPGDEVITRCDVTTPGGGRRRASLVHLTTSDRVTTRGME